jgi:radical SAM superfamily enzyme YgiQ (UPF0313 family)
MKIALVVPPSNFLISQLVYPYLGVLYLAAELDEYDVDILDIGAGDELNFIDYDVIAYTANVTQANEVKKLAEEARFVNPDIFQVVGGIWPSLTRDYLGTDCIVLGEGELALKKAIKEQKFHTVYKPIIQDINKIKFPARDKLDIHRYKGWSDKIKSTPIMSSRGCPFSCAFCSKSPYDKFRMRSPENFIKEVDEVIDMGFQALMIYDDTLNINRKRFIKICNLLKDRNIVWKCHIRADLVDEELVKLMTDSGCIDVAIGFESGSNTILRNIDKKTTVETNTEVAKLFTKYGIDVRAYLILGLPGESLKTVNETRKWLDAGLAGGYIKSFGLGIFMPYPGSPIFENKEKYDIEFEKIDYSKAWIRGKQDELSCFVKTKELSPIDLIHSKESISREFHEFGE